MNGMLGSSSQQKSATSRQWREDRSRAQPIITITTEPVMVIDASKVDTLTLSDEYRAEKIFAENRQRIPLVIQRTIAAVDMFDRPSVPIIFVLGGPGSGKLTHCKQLTKTDRRLAHLELLTTFLEVTSVIASRDPNIIPPYKALEILASCITEAQTEFSGLIVTGYPRNMRDVVEYLARVQRIDGVVLFDWSDRSLERQVQLGSKSVEIDEDLARTELDNYRSFVLPVSQFFNRQGLLHVVEGDRPAPDIFDDFYSIVQSIISPHAHSQVGSRTRKASQGKQPLVDNNQQQAQRNTPAPHVKRVKSLETIDLEAELKARMAGPSAPVIVHKDVENILSIVQADSILERAGSVRPKVRK